MHLHGHPFDGLPHAWVRQPESLFGRTAVNKEGSTYCFSRRLTFFEAHTRSPLRRVALHERERELYTQAHEEVDTIRIWQCNWRDAYQGQELLPAKGASPMEVLAMKRAVCEDAASRDRLATL